MTLEATLEDLYLGKTVKVSRRLESYTAVVCGTLTSYRSLKSDKFFVRSAGVLVPKSQKIWSPVLCVKAEAFALWFNRWDLDLQFKLKHMKRQCRNMCQQIVHILSC